MAQGGIKLGSSKKCPLNIQDNKKFIAMNMVDRVVNSIRQTENKRINAIWLETAGCSGNIISLLNATDPDVLYFLREMVNLTYNNSIMAKEGEQAFKSFLDTLETEFILLVDGAVSLENFGVYNVIANFDGRSITGLEAVKLAGAKAKYVLAVGTCASHGGISAAKPNLAGCVSVGNVLDREVINLPGCPCNPHWVIGTVAQIISMGKPELDSLKRPISFYGVTIHDRCPRRSFFEQGVFATKLSEETCMFKLGCRGPITKTDCPITKWNGHVNWPIGDNTPCIGCAHSDFPDGMVPFVKY